MVWINKILIGLLIVLVYAAMIFLEDDTVIKLKTVYSIVFLLVFISYIFLVLLYEPYPKPKTSEKQK